MSKIWLSSPRASRRGCRKIAQDGVRHSERNPGLRGFDILRAVGTG